MTVVLQGVGAAASGTKAPLAGQWQRTEAPDTAQEVASTSGFLFPTPLMRLCFLKAMQNVLIVQV